MKTVQLVFLDPHLAQETPHNVKSKSIVELIGLTDRGANGASLDVAVGRPTVLPATPTSRLSVSTTSSLRKAVPSRPNPRSRTPRTWRSRDKQAKW